MGVYELVKYHNSVKECPELSGSTTHLSVGDDGAEFGAVAFTNYRLEE